MPLKMKYSMTKRDVQSVFKTKTALATRFFVFKIKANNLEHFRIAFAFSRKQGSAVVRNKFKRRVREICRTHGFDQKGFDILVLCRKPLKAIQPLDWQNEKSKIIQFCENHQ